MNGISSAISAVGGAVGRYFSVVSFIPSLFLSGFTFALIVSGAWSGNGTPDWSKAANAFTHLGNLALLIVVSIVIGMAVHPVQFALVQFFEGYWGVNPVAQRVRRARISHHYHRAEFLTLTGQGPQAYLELQEAKRDNREVAVAYKIMRLSQHEEFYRLGRGYPENLDDIMPTRLGNVLRRYERRAGSQYKLDAVRAIRHLAFIAPRPHVDYLNDQRQLLDLSIRMCMTSIVAVFVAIVFLWHHGPWLAISLVPYGVAYLSYRGAVVVAHEYGATVCALIDLNRFALYDHLRMQPPKSTQAERRMNIKLMELIDHDSTINLQYEQPQSSSGANGTAEAT